MAAKEFDPIDGLFDTYTNETSDTIELKGIEALCEDLEVNRADVRILILAWKMKAKNRDVFTKDEWRRGLEGLGANTIIELRKVLDVLKREMSVIESFDAIVAPEFFENFYIYAFQYNLNEDQRVDIKSVCQLLNVVLGPAFPIQVDLVTEYLKVQRDYDSFNEYHWSGFFPFFKEVRFQNLQSYDASSEVWPEIIDDFVEWFKENDYKL
ncbi:uncharacterized protein LOC133297765 [Gastrolobium bilobum]|uniref:uncharacterized protein LOC133297765 n=1 Tax=Gastrolobium bilobum TaxID=150636 RepID=UPI002AB31D6E|nr:uncharacterized protein LOC133297765 [Gastrolobium bilobum]